MIGDKLVMAQSHLLKEILLVIAALLDKLGDDAETHLFIYTDFEQIITGDTLGDIVKSVDHTVGDNLDLLTVNIGNSGHYARALNLLSLCLCDKLAGLGKNLTCEGRHNGLGKLAAGKSAGDCELFIVFIASDSGYIISVGVEEEIVELLLSRLNGDRLARTQTLEYLHERLALILGLVLLYRCFNSLIVSEELTDFLVRSEAESSDKRCDENFSVLIYSDIVDIVDICLILEPCTPVRVDGAGEKLDTGLVVSHIEIHAGRANKLGNDNSLSTVYNECSALGHHGKLAHENL